MNMSKPEVVVITGASAGIGRATVRAFAKRGAYIGLVARSRDGLEGACREVEEAGGKALVLPTDVSDPDQVEKAAAAVEEAFGPIDIWVNDAMASILSPFMEIKLEDFRRATEVTYLGYVYGTMAALRRMKPRDRGTIVQVGSALAYRSIPLQSAYCGAKAAIRGFTDSLRCELLHDRSNVRLTMVQMPAVNTPQFNWIKSNMPHRPQPVPPIFQPEVAAEAIYWAAHHDRRELYVGSSTVEAILGTKVAPGLLDRYLASSGYSGQQTQELEDKNRPDNLWEPLPGDHGAHGRFDNRAQDWSPQLWATQNQDMLILAAGAGIACVALGAYLGSQSQPKQSAATEHNGNKITGSEISSEVVRQVNPASKIDQLQILMGLAQLGWKALAGKPQKNSRAE
ncbi:MAG: SDR family oxidoreductase [Chroococcidiopsidaceae cyanobacterium CP_BM_ER_R8_30]|nr:SDR family oxidoreductase [Chroococcidiopsidaceae cyanobacterium CP_BM_ER_R8_30]